MSVSRPKERSTLRLGRPTDDQENGAALKPFRNRNIWSEWALHGPLLPPAWMRHAECAKPEHQAVCFIADNRGYRDLVPALRVCLACPVRAECLSYAVGNEDLSTTFGVWGGLTADQRKRIYRLRFKRKPKRPTVVYFAERDGLIKIGMSGVVEKRMAALHCSLLATYPGGRDLERRMHERFAADAVGGEWFKPSPELRNLIRGLQQHTVEAA